MKLPSIKGLLGLTTSEMTTPQAEGGITGVRKAWAESYASGLTPARLAGILRDCDNGDIEAFMTLAEEMEERDPHYASVLGQRKRAISGVAPTLIPASESAEDQRIADWVNEKVIEGSDFARLVEDLMDAVGKGFSVIEITWTPSGFEWRPTALSWRPQRYFRPDRETGEELRLLTDAEPFDGEPLPWGKYLTHRSAFKSGLSFRAGIARVVAFSWMCKAYTVKDWTAFIELYGLPVRLGRYGKDATKKDISTLFRAVANIGTDAAAVIPESMRIEFIEAKSGSGSQPVFENLARYLDEQISKAVLGQTMTTDNGSSMAQAQVHNDVRLDIAQSDARTIAETIQRDLIAPAVVINFGANKPQPRLKIDISEPEDVSARVKDIVALAGAGVRFREAEARSLVRMSDPEKGDELFGGAPAKPSETALATGLARTEHDHAPDVIDEISADMLDRWQPVMAELLGPIRAAIEDAADLPDALERLNELETLPQGKLIEELVIGLFKARTAGDVADG